MPNCSKNICIAGKNEIAVYALDLLIRSYPKSNLYCVHNDSDPGYDTWQPSFKRFSQKNHIKIISLQDCYKLDNLIFISLEFDKIIKPELFVSNKLYNIHFSKLPAYKGMYTSCFPLLFGEIESGVTLHCIDEKIDTGAIIDQIAFPISGLNSAKELYFLYLQESKRLFEKNIVSLIDGSINSKPQSCIGSSYYSKSSIDYSNIKIDLKKTAFQIANQIRAFSFREYQFPNVLGWYIHSAELTSINSTQKPGNIISDNMDYMSIATIDYNVVLHKDKLTYLNKLVESNNINEAKLIIPKISDLNVRNSNGWTPLMIASYHGSCEMISLLINSGADPNFANYKGTTPLMYAMSNFEKTNNKKPFEILTDRGADPNMIDVTGRSLKDYAKERKIKNL